MPGNTLSMLMDLDLGTDDICQIVDQGLASFRQVLDDIASQTNPTFANTVAPIARQDNEYESATGLIMFLQYVSPDKKIRHACAAAAQKTNEFYVEFGMRKDVHKAVRAVFDDHAEMATLCPEDRLYIERTVRQLEHNGLALNKEKQEQLANISIRLYDLESAFCRNITEYEDKAEKDEGRLLFCRSELAGVPDSFFENRPKQCIAGTDMYVVSPHQHDYSEILNHAVNEATRKKIFVAHGQMHADNIPILQEIVGLRKQQAGLLGYKSYSHYVLESQMAKTPQAVKELETQLHGKLAQAAAQEHGKLVDMKRNNTEAAGRAPTRVYDWDYPYYANMVTKKKHGVDHSIIKQYFVCEATVEGILDVFRDMLGLEIVSVSLPHVWHPDVQAYEVWETDGHVHVGCFFLDLFSRPGKYDHPAVWTIRPGYEHVDKTRAHPISALVAGFPKAESTTPTLLKHQHVKILLHEFGHLFHGICSSTKWSRFHGTTGPVDFVEAPSQMMEYWAWEPCFLRRVARHYKTKEPLPEQLLKDLVASRNDEIGIDKISQVFLGMYDLRIHSKDIEDIDVSKLYNSMHRELAFSDIGDAEVYPVAASMQMANGYAGLYYGYLWSEMISADMFATRFLADGIDNKETGMEYRNEILRPGDSRDPAISLEKFIGRKPNATAFLEMIS